MKNSKNREVLKNESVVSEKGKSTANKKDRLNKRIDRRTEKRKVGDIGESVACNYLLKENYKIIGRNYLKKFGEIDIIAEKGGIYHFVEVKTVTHVTMAARNGAWCNG
jgi:hypothetical protein